MNGAVDIDPRAELAISGEQLRDLWARARERSVAIRVLRLRDGSYLAAVARRGSQVTSTSDHPYKAAIAALGQAA